MTFEDMNQMKQAPAFKDMSDEQWLRAMRLLYVNCKDLQCKDGVLFIGKPKDQDKQ